MPFLATHAINTVRLLFLCCATWKFKGEITLFGLRIIPTLTMTGLWLPFRHHYGSKPQVPLFAVCPTFTGDALGRSNPSFLTHKVRDVIFGDV